MPISMEQFIEIPAMLKIKKNIKTTATYKLKNAYKQYLATGILPE